MVEKVEYVRIDKNEARRRYNDGEVIVMSLNKPPVKIGETVQFEGVTTIQKGPHSETFERLAEEGLQWKHRYPGSQGLVWFTPAPPRPTFGDVAVPTVLGGAYIPAHDMTFDIAESIGNLLDAFQSYVTQVRDADQAGDAVEELLQAFLKQAQKRGAPPVSDTPPLSGWD